jgi:putative tricarboxylic transport membrane protein
MRRALQLSDGDLTGLVNTPFSVAVYVVVAALLAWPLLRRAFRKPAMVGQDREADSEKVDV